MADEDVRDCDAPRFPTPLCEVSDLDAGRRALDVDGVAFLVIEDRGQWQVVDGECPHQYFPLEFGDVQDGVLACPLHGWRFDLRTGRSPDSPQICIRRWPVRREGDHLVVDS
ncbi:MAG: Rieske 2Fe-2S domain-containing protein [Deltaproteobacteria bacterium]|nr:Rieske 2Fe-2S domain-containing protein [Deltaproteobacteria bacterium]